MNWVVIVAIAVPILFVIGMINNAFKDQKKLEDGALRSYLSKRKGKRANGYDDDDDDDDWGVKARALKRAVKEDNTPSDVTSSDALAREGAASCAISKDLADNIDTLHPYAPRSSEASYKPMGDTQATNAASYFSAYYKQDEVKDEKEASSAAPKSNK